MRWPKRAAPNGYDLGRDAPFGIVRLPAHSSWLGDRRGAARGASFLFHQRDGDRTMRYDASDSGGKSDLAGGKGLSPYVQIVSNWFFAAWSKTTEAFPFLPHLLASWMAAWIASSWLEHDRSWSFDLTTHCPLRLSTMNWVSATLVEPAEQPDQQDDWDRDPDQPEQKTFTHCVLLFRLAHINVRWELRFHGMTRAERGEAGSCERGRVRVRSVQARWEYICGNHFVI